MQDEVSEAGRELWRRLWTVGFDVRQAWATLSNEDRRLLADELRTMAAQVREAQTREGTR